MNIKCYFSIPVQINYDLIKLSKNEVEKMKIMIEKLLIQLRQWIDGILMNLTTSQSGKLFKYRTAVKCELMNTIARF